MGLMHRLNNVVTRSLPLKQAQSQLTTAIASVTFDDFPRSAWTVGGPILQRFDARGTYYAAGRYCGAREDGVDYYDEADLKAVLAAGHEIGAHSFGHDKAPMLSADALASDADANAARLSPLLGRAMCSYAYPYGEVSPRTKAAMGQRFATARGIGKGINAGLLDLAQLKAVPLEARRWRPDEIDAWVEAAVARKGWLVFFTHDVCDDPSPFGCTPRMLTYALERLQGAGISSLTVRQAMARAVFGEG